MDSFLSILSAFLRQVFIRKYEPSRYKCANKASALAAGYHVNVEFNFVEPMGGSFCNEIGLVQQLYYLTVELCVANPFTTILSLMLPPLTAASAQICGGLDPTANKRIVCSAALDAGFARARIFAPFNPDMFMHHGEKPHYGTGAGSLLVCALPYGNQHDAGIPPANAAAAGLCPGVIAPFARFNYYREAVKRMKHLANHLRMRYGGVKGDYRIFCNSPLPEKLIARESGLGAIGRNSLIINAESGSLFIIATMALPITLETDLPISGRLSNFCAPGAAAADLGALDFPLCTDCGENPPCAAACPTGAALGNGHIDRAKCIQWYASGHSASSFASSYDADEIPADVRAVWGNRLYGCTCCLDACVHNKRPIKGVQTGEGPLPAFIDARELLRLSDCEIKALFKGTAMGLSWLGAKAIRRNAEMASRPAPASGFQYAPR